MWLDDQQTALYRLFAEDGSLLYTGVTADPDKRWVGHQSTKPWWSAVFGKTVSWYENRPSALAAELKAIKNEAPRYNVAGSPWAPGPRKLKAGELNCGQAKTVLHAVELGASVADPLVVVDQKKARRPQAVLVSPEWYERAKTALAAEKS